MVPYWQQGGSIFSDDRSKFTVNNEKAVRALQWHMKQFAAQGGWPAIKAFHEGTNFNQQFGNGIMTHLYATNASRPTINGFEGLSWVYASYGLPSEGGELATYTGDWALCLPSGSENPDGGFAFLDFMYRPDIDLKWSIAMDRIPVQKATAQSADYTEGDPFKEFVIAQMEGAHFWLGVPGIAVIRREVNTMLNDLKNGKTTIPEALAQYEKAGQDFAGRVGRTTRTVETVQVDGGAISGVFRTLDKFGCRTLLCGPCSQDTIQRMSDRDRLKAIARRKRLYLTKRATLTLCLNRVYSRGKNRRFSLSIFFFNEEQRACRAKRW